MDSVSQEQRRETTKYKLAKRTIKALGVFFTYDQTLLCEKNFRDKLDKIKKLVTIGLLHVNHLPSNLSWISIYHVTKK